ncbi:MAG: 30S ribosomal protein S15 [Candidatus Dependentiae bacterium ADurb.Bin331]|nr:MAG: 30S ribosomal protein S15 [Candidatus Dependentiae bacterium ADurb.Bin331]
MAEQVTKKTIIEKFSQHAQDTGSVEVQIALLTEHMNRLTEHFEKNPKDFSSKRGLLKIVNKRRQFLKYLEKSNEEQYKVVTKRLQI